MHASRTCGTPEKQVLFALKVSPHLCELWTTPNDAELLELIQVYLNILARVLEPTSLGLKKLLTCLCSGVEDATRILFAERERERDYNALASQQA